MKINVVCSDEGWIYSKFIEEMQKHSKHDVLLNSKESCDVTHYIPYYEVPNNPPRPCTTWLSHQEKRRDLSKKFVSAAQAVDVGLSHSKKYTKLLRDNHHRQNVVSVIPGVDLDQFLLRDVERPANDKIVVGYVGRQYTSSDRKNPKLLKQISELPYVDFKTTGGNLSADQIPDFYRSLDVVVSPATIEGGPMAVQEALACGVPVIAMKDVGVAAEFGEGVIKAEGDADFMAKLKDMWLTKYYLNYWRTTDVMNKMRQQVASQTWKRFVEEHDKVWEMIASDSWRKSKE